MARPKSKAPAIRYHVSGQSVVEIDGTTFYLGEHQSPESLARYAVLIATYQSNGLKLPAGFDSQQLREIVGPIGNPLASVNVANEPIRIRHLLTGFEKHAEVVYATSKAELYRIRALVREIIGHDGEVLAVEYGPRKLKEQRERWVQSGKCRKYCNRLTQLVVSMFGWGVSEELIDESTWTRLKSVQPLRNGQTAAPESEDRSPIDLETVRATVKELSPVLRAMVRIQVATGMRPTELCIMRPMDVDRTGAEWLYRPSQHKNKAKGKSRVIPILSDAREALTDYLNRPDDAYFFSPTEVMTWWQAKKRSERKTKVQPSQTDRSKENPQTKPGERYTQNSYRVAIYRACDRAKVQRWFPYQIRHLNLTEVRDALSAEQAQAIGGHSRIDMTMTYAKASIEKAIEAARSAPKL